MPAELPETHPYPPIPHASLYYPLHYAASFTFAVTSPYPHLSAGLRLALNEPTSCFLLVSYSRPKREWAPITGFDPRSVHAWLTDNESRVRLLGWVEEDGKPRQSERSRDWAEKKDLTKLSVYLDLQFTGESNLDAFTGYLEKEARRCWSNSLLTRIDMVQVFRKVPGKKGEAVPIEREYRPERTRIGSEEVEEEDASEEWEGIYDGWTERRITADKQRNQESNTREVPGPVGISLDEERSNAHCQEQERSKARVERGDGNFGNETAQRDPCVYEQDPSEAGLPAARSPRSKCPRSEASPPRAASSGASSQSLYFTGPEDNMSVDHDDLSDSIIRDPSSRPESGRSSQQSFLSANLSRPELKQRRSPPLVGLEATAHKRSRLSPCFSPSRETSPLQQTQNSQDSQASQAYQPSQPSLPTDSIASSSSVPQRALDLQIFPEMTQQNVSPRASTERRLSNLHDGYCLTDAAPTKSQSCEIIPTGGSQSPKDRVEPLQQDQGGRANREDSLGLSRDSSRYWSPSLSEELRLTRQEMNLMRAQLTEGFGDIKRQLVEMRREVRENQGRNGDLVEEDGDAWTKVNSAGD
ncbi:hypothetical protein M011DRAFT_471081 [Sporormia fimetaria CBS 119925]|uniref:Uncharacterized protein n=1 Tax=Sporormia fimetaria CBS 119925 TaxID=1340428 RepID=A0A6A6UZM9_9PLEO|nr:hypothetical protein M011DRAFT_471081 [Sporormia fimetaria CBS 119925]